jgi:hypothetical protein
MSDRVIRLEEQSIVDPQELDQLMRLVPSDQRGDIRLKRFLAFRLKLDGLVATQVYLTNQLVAAEKSGYRGRLFAFLSEDHPRADDASN